MRRALRVFPILIAILIQDLRGSSLGIGVRRGRPNNSFGRPVLFFISIISLAACSPALARTMLSTPIPEPTVGATSEPAAEYPRQALYLLEVEAARDGWTAEQLRRAGDLWRQAGDLTRALPYWQAAYDQSPSLPVARALAETYLSLARWSDAAGALESLLDLAPNDAWAHYHLGLVRAPFDPTDAAERLQGASNAPDYETPVARLTDVLTANPADPLMPMRVGLVLVDLELWPYAELAFTQAATVAAPFPLALAYVALARDRQGKDGAPWIEQAVSLAPDDPQIRYLQALHRRTVGDLVGSLDSMAQAVALDPENPALLAELGATYQLLGDLSQADYWLGEAVALSNGDPRFQTLFDQFRADLSDTVPDTTADPEATTTPESP